MKVVFIAGPFRGANAWEVQQNVRQAEALAMAVWRLGAMAYCPHKNTEHFDKALPDQVFLDGNLEMLRRCDAILMTPDWERSSGAKGEYEEAFNRAMPILFSVEHVNHWLAYLTEHEHEAANAV